MGFPDFVLHIIVIDAIPSPLEIEFVASKSKSKTASPGVPAKYALQQNYPNPFNPATTINYQLPENVHVTVKIYDVLGREVMTLVNESESAGYKSVKLYASGLPSAVYFYRLQAGSFSETMKMVVLK